MADVDDIEGQWLLYKGLYLFWNKTHTNYLENDITPRIDTT